MLNFYSKETQKLHTQSDYELSTDDTEISWTVNLRKAALDNKEIIQDDTTRIVSFYRPFTLQNLHYQRDVIERPGQWDKIIPKDLSNSIICVSGIGSNKPFTSLLINLIPSLDFVEKAQCFPLYWYEENKTQQGTLFDFDTPDDKYIRHDGVTDWILKEVRRRFGNAKAITKEHIFYYVYGILHSPQYRERFAADLKKSLPRIPIVDNVQDFMAFYKAGKALAELHLNYEQMPPSPDVVSHIADAVYQEPTDDAPFGYTKYDHFAVDKMAFPKVRNQAGKLVPDKSRIIYNGNITIENIPAKAYEYIVNGKSAIEWIMERYAITQDSKSLIINDPNDWSREHHNPTYIYDLLLSVINLSVQSVDIINSLPKLKI